MHSRHTKQTWNPQGSAVFHTSCQFQTVGETRITTQVGDPSDRKLARGWRTHNHQTS